jgi:trans-aconitate methyltransferase
MSESEWTDSDHVELYLSRLGEGPGSDGDVLVLELVPQPTARILDLGTGDGRLIDLLRRDRPSMNAVGIDSSPLMLERARARFAENRRIETRLRCASEQCVRRYEAAERIGDQLLCTHPGWTLDR